MKLDIVIERLKQQDIKIENLEKQMYELSKEVLILQTRLNELEDELEEKGVIE